MQHAQTAQLFTPGHPSKPDVYLIPLVYHKCILLIYIVNVQKYITNIYFNGLKNVYSEHLPNRSKIYILDGKKMYI